MHIELQNHSLGKEDVSIRARISRCMLPRCILGTSPPIGRRRGLLTVQNARMDAYQKHSALGP